MLLLTFGAPDKNRTRNLQIRSLTLYPVELQARISCKMEVPAGFEPAVIELQSIALPTWLRNHYSAMYYITRSKNVSRENNNVIISFD